ncbi:MAG: hypothetical protein JWQ64_211 [Subtercola sp.]|jgi:sugar/nucleoside kinase (ribokinase family)|nr:hypothetical protein [Subtercola sp.]
MVFNVGVRGGLSVDHLVVVGRGARFDELGGPGLYGALGGRLVEGVAIRLSAALPSDEPRFGELFKRLDIDDAYCDVETNVTRVWILNSAEGRRIVSTSPSGEVELEVSTSVEADEAEQPARAEFFAGLTALLDSSPLSRPQSNEQTVVGIDPHQVPLRRAGTEYLRLVVPQAGVLLPSRVQLALIHPDVRVAARQISAELDVPVIARLDVEGAHVFDGSKEWTVQDDHVTVSETTGAGDSSAAAIMAALAIGADIVTAAMFGVSIARIALADWGSAALLEAEPLTKPFNGIRTNRER